MNQAEALPAYVPKTLVAERLSLIFPDGTPNRNYCTRDLAAATVFTLIYIGAVEGSDRYLSPKHVYRMTDEQAERASDIARHGYSEAILRPKAHISGRRWYADNTREPIRDETLREGLVAIGAVVARQDLPTTSSKPRYALKSDLAALFDPELEGDDLEQAIAEWQARNLSKSALTRIALQQRGAAMATEGVSVTFPNGETRRLARGPSSVISKAVIEIFGARFLGDPAVLWLSESGNKVVTRDQSLAEAIGLHIEADRDLPDIILVDLAPEHPLIVFVEVVATDGAVTERRQQALLKLTEKAGFDVEQVTFVTAYADRHSAGFKKTVSNLSWGAFAWFVSEPENIVLLRKGEERELLLSVLRSR